MKWRYVKGWGSKGERDFSVKLIYLLNAGKATGNWAPLTTCPLPKLPLETDGQIVHLRPKYRNSGKWSTPHPLALKQNTWFGLNKRYRWNYFIFFKFYYYVSISTKEGFIYLCFGELKKSTFLKMRVQNSSGVI